MAELGERIREALAADERDLLTRWMATRLAELLDAAEHARGARRVEEAKREATDLILTLWERRRTWPKGWPPPAVRAVFGDIDDSAAGTLAGDSPWLAALERLDALAAEERELWLEAIRADTELEMERARRDWQSRPSVDGDNDELMDAELLVWELRTRLPQMSDEQGVPKDPVQRADVIARRLDAIARSRRDLVEEVVAAVGRSKTVRRPGKRRQATDSGEAGP